MKTLAGRTAALLIALLVLAFLDRSSGAAGGFTYLPPAELRQMMEQKVPGLVLIDSRSGAAYDEGHIKGAVSLSLGTMEADASLPNLPKETPLVFYCSGTT